MSETTGYADIDDMCNRLKNLHDDGQIAGWCEERIRYLCDKCHAQRKIIDDIRAELDAAKAENERLRAAMTAVREGHYCYRGAYEYTDDEDSDCRGCDLEELCAALENVESNCDWTEDADGVWHRECDGGTWVCENGTPAENGMRYCPACGKVLMQIDHSERKGDSCDNS